MQRGINMAVITIGQQKGGVGKSTMVTNLAMALKKLKCSVIIVDADKQRSLADWVSFRDESGIKPTIPCVEKLGNVRETLLELNEKYDFVIVDAAGRDSRELRTALAGSHFFVTPFQASQFDLNTVVKVNEIINDAKDLNPNLVALGFLNRVPSNALNTECAEAKALLEECGNFIFMTSKIHDRKVYRSCASEGTSVIESKNPKAKNEVYKFVMELLGQIEMRFPEYA